VDYLPLSGVPDGMTLQSNRRVRVAALGELPQNVISSLEPYTDRIELVHGTSADRPFDFDVLIYDSTSPTDTQRLLAAIEGAGAPKVARQEEWFGEAEGLTPRESQVVALIAGGRTNQQIAEECHVTLNTVKTYIRTAYQKMGVYSRTQAVVWAIAHGLELPEPWEAPLN
jgi:DNA-binding CsgD family transcriptional regulator